MYGFRQVLLPVLGAVLSIFLLVSNASANPKIGEPAPEFSAVDTNGKAVNLKDLKGKTVVLEWTNHQCPFVRKHYGSGNMQAIQKAAVADGVVWISVVSSAPGRQGHVDAAKANALTTERKASPSSVILDESGDIGQKYNATATPNMFVINKEGKLVYRGAIDDKPSASPSSLEGAKNFVTLALKAVAEGKDVELASTRPYGCSVKYGL